MPEPNHSSFSPTQLTLAAVHVTTLLTQNQVRAVLIGGLAFWLNFRNLIPVDALDFSDLDFLVTATDPRTGDLINRLKLVQGIESVKGVWSKHEFGNKRHKKVIFFFVHSDYGRIPIDLHLGIVYGTILANGDLATNWANTTNVAINEVIRGFPGGRVYCANPKVSLCGTLHQHVAQVSNPKIGDLMDIMFRFFEEQRSVKDPFIRWKGLDYDIDKFKWFLDRVFVYIDRGVAEHEKDPRIQPELKERFKDWKDKRAKEVRNLIDSRNKLDPFQLDRPMRNPSHEVGGPKVEIGILGRAKSEFVPQSCCDNTAGRRSGHNKSSSLPSLRNSPGQDEIELRRRDSTPETRGDRTETRSGPFSFLRRSSRTNNHGKDVPEHGNLQLCGPACSSERKVIHSAARCDKRYSGPVHPEYSPIKEETNDGRQPETPEEHYRLSIGLHTPLRIDFSGIGSGGNGQDLRISANANSVSKSTVKATMVPRGRLPRSLFPAGIY
jgi:hypothetical protein